jgi:hypothetical protein
MFMTQMLQKEYDQIRQTFFPSWDRDGEWGIVEKAGPHAPHGYLDEKEKVIGIQSMGPGQSLRVVLIHEIAHAVTSISHGKKWQNRMNKSAQKAESIGETKLAEALREEVRLYTEPFAAAKPTADAVYNRVKDECLTCPQPSFDEVVDCIRYECGLTKEEFLRHFKRSQRIYEKTRA